MSVLLASPVKTEIAKLKVRRGKAQKIVSVSKMIEVGDEWSVVEYPYLQQSELLADVLWHLDDVEIVEPDDARTAIISLLHQAVSAHG
jgi:predicted DNA-binding transcriptional regulator YafY